MEQYQRDQLQLQQFYQQQRIMELQMARQRQMEMEAQNVTRFGMMRDRALSAIAPAGGYVSSELGMGRNIGLPNAQGVATQSLFGAAVDANFAGGGTFFRTAGFQFNMTEAAVRQRARQALRVRTSQIGNQLKNAFVPEFLQRKFGMVGMGDIEERSLEIMDAFAGMRGRGANIVTGRGILGTEAADIAEAFTKRMNKDFDGMLSGDAIGQLQTAALTMLTSRDIAEIGGAGALKTSKAEDMLAQAVKELQGIARNTGISTNRLSELAAENKAMGNDPSDMARIGNVVGSSMSTTEANRERQFRLGMSLTAQGRMLGVADAVAFGQRGLQDVMDLETAFNVGAANRADLFRYGGKDPFDAATRVQGRRVEAGQFFAQQMTPMMGVLGRGLENSLRGGLLGFMGDVSQAIVNDPFAPLKARTNFDTQQLLILNNTRLAMQNAKNVVDMMGIDDPEAALAMRVQMVARSTNRTEMDARREMNLIDAEDNTVKRAVDKLPGLSDQEKAALTQRVGLGMSTFQRYGMSRSDVLNRSFLNRMLESPNKDAVELMQEDLLSRDTSEINEAIASATGEDALKSSYGKGKFAAGKARDLDGYEFREALRIVREMYPDDPRLTNQQVGLYATSGMGEDMDPDLASRASGDMLRYSLGTGAEARRRVLVQAEFSPERLFQTMERNDLFTEQFARIVRDMDLKGGTADLGSAQGAMEMFKSGQYDEIQKAVGREGMLSLGVQAAQMFTRGMTRANEKAEELSTLGTKGNAMYVRPAPGAEFF